MCLKKLLFKNSFFDILLIGDSMNNILKKIISFIFFTLIIVCFIIFITWFIKDKDNKTNNEQPIEYKTYLNNVTYKQNIDKDLENKIIEYMDLYYKSMKELKEYDMTYLFSNEEQAYINQTAISLLIEIRKLKTNDLTLDSAWYDIEIKSVTEKNNEIVVIVNENNNLRFNFMKDIESRIYNIENEFTFKYINGEYKIEKYNKVQDFYVMVTSKYTSGGKIELDKIKNDYLKLVKLEENKLKNNYTDFLNNKGLNKKVCDHNYDRNKAYNYAIKWVSNRNNEWPKYESNCQNYASQVVYNGGIPMDYFGDKSLQWKSYSSSYNEQETPNGLVYTWTYVPYFYDYVKNNTGYGLCGDVDANLYYAESGDIIHVGINSPDKHALVVIDSYEKEGKVVDILVNSNTVDLENYPISAYVYPYTRLIKIYGWNE